MTTMTEVKGVSKTAAAALPLDGNPTAPTVAKVGRVNVEDAAAPGLLPSERKRTATKKLGGVESQDEDKEATEVKLPKSGRMTMTREGKSSAGAARRLLYKNNNNNKARSTVDRFTFCDKCEQLLYEELSIDG